MTPLFNSNRLPETKNAPTSLLITGQGAGNAKFYF